MKQQISNFAGEVKFEWNGFDINDVLRAIKYRPALFIGNEKTINNLWIYLKGYSDALNITGKQECSYPNHYQFGDWITGRFNKKYRSSWSWNHDITKKCKGDGEKALEKFFKYYDEFSQSKPVCYQIKISEKHKDFAKTASVIKRFKSTQNYEQEKTIIAPETVLIFQLPPSKTHWFVYINADNIIDYENVEMSFSAIKERIDKEFQTDEQDWQKLSSMESLNFYNKIYISKELSTETRFITVTTESF